MMIINSDVKWDIDEGMTTNQLVVVDGVAYLRVTEMDADGNVLRITDTRADQLRADIARQPEEPCTSGTFTYGMSKIGYLPSEVFEIENHLAFQNTDSASGEQNG